MVNRFGRAKMDKHVFDRLNQCDTSLAWELVSTEVITQLFGKFHQ